MIYGMLASKRSLLLEIGRNLNEKIPLRKTITRLSGNLNDFSNGEELFGKYLNFFNKSQKTVDKYNQMIYNTVLQAKA